MTRTYPWGTKRRFNAYIGFFRKKFRGRVQKLAVDAGFTCPNRDGTKGTGGCTYCNNNAFNPKYCSPHKPIGQQLQEGMEYYKKRYRKTHQYLAYFQPYTNTYGRLEHVKNLYEQALEIPGLIGLVIGTRPDCVDDEKLEYFRKLSDRYHIVLEYGIESCFNDTLALINRGHTWEESAEAIRKTAAKGIHVAGHMIVGLPGESRKDLIHEIELLSGLPLSGVKFHQLQIVKNTQMAAEYAQNPGKFSLFGLDEYLGLMAELLERLRPDIIVERIAGEAHRDFLIAPDWGLRYDQVLERFEKKLEEKDTWQGKKYEKETGR